jgi:hypothetical protein
MTFISNKPYLGWPRHTWDPMLLGILLTGVAVIVRRWLDHGVGRQRHGYTAERLSEKDKHWVNAGSAVFGLLRLLTRSRQHRKQTVRPCAWAEEAPEVVARPANFEAAPKTPD